MLVLQRMRELKRPYLLRVEGNACVEAADHIRVGMGRDARAGDDIARRQHSSVLRKRSDDRWAGPIFSICSTFEALAGRAPRWQALRKNCVSESTRLPIASNDVA